MRQLSERELKFAEAFIATGCNEGEAAIQAGYSPKNANSAGNRLLRKPLIENKIKELREPIQAQCGITRDSLIKELEEIALNAKSEEYPNYSAILKAKELQAKMLGFFDPEPQRVNNYNILISNQQNKQTEEIPIAELE